MIHTNYNNFLSDEKLNESNVIEVNFNTIKSMINGLKKTINQRVGTIKRDKYRQTVDGEKIKKNDYYYTVLKDGNNEIVYYIKYLGFSKDENKDRVFRLISSSVNGDISDKNIKKTIDSNKIIKNLQKIRLVKKSALSNQEEKILKNGILEYESKNDKQKPVENKPNNKSDNKQKPVENKPNNDKQKPVENKPNNDKQKPVENKPNNDKQKPIENKPNNDKQKPIENKEETSTDEKTQNVK